MFAKMKIVASKLFDSSETQVIHMPFPSAPGIQALFHELPDLEWIVVTDCVSPLYETDLARIAQERTLTTQKTHLEGVFVLHKSFGFDKRQRARSWAQMLA